MNKLPNNPLNLKGEVLKTRNNTFEFDLSKELETDPPKQEVIKDKEDPKEEIKKSNNKKADQEKNKTEKKDIKQSKTYRLPQQLVSDIEKIVYMDRELRGNETTLITKAIEKYIYSKENKELIEQYNQLKGSN